MALTAGWITYTSLGEEVAATSTQTMTITPTKDNIGTYTVGVTYTTTHGADHIYTAMNLVIQCAVTGFSSPADPTALAYNVFDPADFVDVAALTYVQTPACGYAFTSVFTWTGTTDFITVDSGNGGRINVQTNDVNDAVSTSLTVANSITIADNNGASSTFDLNAGADLVSVTVDITDPCSEA